jgi:ABC-type multidrug transport system fused ATPase/permease subunit
MKLLFLSALKNRKHLVLAILTLSSLIFLTVANQMERCGIGLMANQGTDFFKLFSDEKDKSNISLDNIEKTWEKITGSKDLAITKVNASKYMMKKEQNPLGYILNKISVEFDIEKNFLSLILFLIIIAIYKAVTLFLCNYSTQLLSIRVSKDLRQQYFEHIQTLPMSFYNKHNLGTLSSRAVGDAGQIASSLNSMLINYLQTPFTIVTSLWLCVYISWKLSMIIFLGLPLIIIPIVVLTKRVKRVSRQLQKNQENFTSVLLDFLAGIQTVKVFAMENFSLQKYKDQNDRMSKLESKSAKYSILTRPILHTITTACLVIVVMFGLYVLNMTIAQLLVFCAVLHLFYEPVKKFAEENANIQRGVVAAERMFDVLKIKPQIEDDPNALKLEKFEKEIEFKNVSFKYGNDWILKNLSFNVKKGQTVAIVGPTGAGKSTIVQLLPRLFDVQGGDILVDGISIKKYSQKSLRENIAFIPQKPFLFYDTISENISFGRKHFTKEDIKAASISAHAHEFITNLENKYDSLIAENGKNLSGGQQQRLAIARALIKKAPILVMDEATSSLDAISEDKIKLAIKELHGKVTQIIIAHRLSTIEHADKIIYLDRGRKINEGTKDELLQNCIEFKLMWESYHKLKREKVLV